MANNKAFNTISRNRMSRTAFNLTHDVKLTMNMGDLVPVFLQEVVPGDRFRIRVENLIRMMPMLAPMMHRVNVFMHFFYVPTRIIWDDFEDFITGGENGDSLPNHPKFFRDSNLPNAFATGSLCDYLGIPVKNISGVSSLPLSLGFSQLPFRAYQLIYNEYYRDQNLTEEIAIDKSSNNAQFGSGPSNIWTNQSWKLRKRAWEKDYFTSALPWTQRGPQMSLPIGERAPVEYDWNDPNSEPFFVKMSDSQAPFGDLSTSAYGIHAGDGDSRAYNPDGTLFANLENVSSTTINELRQAFQIQKWLERSARTGSRYTEFLQSFFDVNPQDSRLQRPEFLGGSKQPIMISEVLSTAETGGKEVGSMAGHGISTSSTPRISKFFPEHGYVMGIMSVLPRTGYSQGLPRMYTKFDKFDYFFKEFAHLGEQAILNKEIYYDPLDPEYSNAEFGYTGRYNEYRYVPDRVHGDFLDTLDYWHLSRLFDDGEEPPKPTLSKNFVEANVSKRIFAVQDNTHKLQVQLLFDFQAVRPIPRYGTPGGI